MPQRHRTTLNFTIALLLTLAGCATNETAMKPTTPEPLPHGAVPTAQHLKWHGYEFYAFVHFNMNTFTGVEWGHGEEQPEQFHPTEFDADQWCSLFKECGLTGVIITAKHHDGFCLWPSKFTEHDVANSKWRDGNGDVIRELADACKRHDLFLGIYISPWDQNNPIYGKEDDAYNTYFAGQMEELLGNYGDVAEVWWDGANGDRNNPEKHQEYDWDLFNQTVARLQPNAVTFGPPYANMPIGARWVGNERGYANATQWSTYPIDVPERAGELNVGVEGADTWFPAETDVSIRSGWYWHPDSDDKVKSVDHLLDIYYRSVGHNTNLLLNFAVDRRGLVHENEAAALRTMTNILRATFAHDLAKGCVTCVTHVGSPEVRGNDLFYGPSRMTDGDNSTYWSTDDGQLTATASVLFDGPTTFNRIVLQEHITLGQRVRAWNVEALIDGEWQAITNGTTIGYKRIARFDTVTATELRLNITNSRACPTISTFGVFAAPAEVTIAPAARVFIGSTTIELTTDLPNHAIHYTVDGSTPTAQSTLYEQRITVVETTKLKAVAIREDGAVSPITASLALVGYDSADLSPSRQFLREPDAGLNVARYEGGWQTLEQMTDRQPVSRGTCETFTMDELSRDEHAALAFTGHILVPTDGIYEMFVKS
ncbi:MAG: alpha-L-fucosidase, partial [Hyphomicrobiaceae bacterium]